MAAYGASETCINEASTKRAHMRCHPKHPRIMTDDGFWSLGWIQAEWSMIRKQEAWSTAPFARQVSPRVVNPSHVYIWQKQPLQNAAFCFGPCSNFFFSIYWCHISHKHWFFNCDILSQLVSQRCCLCKEDKRNWIIPQGGDFSQLEVAFKYILNSLHPFFPILIVLVCLKFFQNIDCWRN